jgi:phosphoribosylglycinamide formyltransferase-1
MNRRLAVLISGRGSNLQSIIDAIARGELDATIAIVLSNRPEAAGLQRARDAGVETLVVGAREYVSRDAYDRAVADVLRSRDVSLVCLAGFMRLIGAPLLDAFPNKVLNIHPSLLPSFPGLDAQRQAIEHGVRVSGATVHLVTAELDGGPIILQSAVPVLDDDTPDTLAALILIEEHLGQASGNLSNLEGVGQPIVEDFALAGAYDLSHPCQAAKCRGVENTIPV